MNRDPQWNEENQTGHYARPVHHGEITKIISEQEKFVSEFKQNLAAPEGMDLAKRLLRLRQQRLNNNI